MRLPGRAGPPCRRRGEHHGRIGASGDPLRDRGRHAVRRGPVHPPPHDGAVAVEVLSQGRGGPAQGLHAIPESHPFQGVHYLIRPFIDAASISKAVVSADFYFVTASGSSSPVRGPGTMLLRQARKQPPSGRRLLKHPERGVSESLCVHGRSEGQAGPGRASYDRSTLDEGAFSRSVSASESRPRWCPATASGGSRRSP